MNQYKWLEQHFMDFYLKICEANNIIPHPDVNEGIITAHGDKCYQYKREWESNGIHFFHGCACYLLSYLLPWSTEVRDTQSGWVKPVQWVMDNYDARFRPYLPMIQPVELSHLKSETKPTAEDQKVQWVSAYYPIGYWQDEDGNRLEIDNHYFRVMRNGREVAVMLVEVTEAGGHGESSLTGLIPQFVDVETSKRIQLDRDEFVTLIGVTAKKVVPVDPHRGLVQVYEVLPGRGLVSSET